MSFTVYSWTDTTAVLYHPSFGRADLTASGLGKLAISRSGDLSSHTQTADGSVVVNRLRSENGTVTLTVTQNSAADEFLRRWAAYLRSLSDSSSFARSALTVTDNAGRFTVSLTGVTPQKIPDRTYDKTSTEVVWVLLAASITEQ